MGVQVGRADGQPPVIDDAHLGVDVQPVVTMAGQRPDRRGEQPAGVVVGADQHAELAHGVVVAVVGLRREDDHDPELVARRVAQLVREQVDDLGRPQELVLEVHEPLRTADRAHVALEDPEVPGGDGVVHALGDRPDDLDGVLAGRGRRVGRPLQRLAGQLAPAQREVIVHVGDRRPAQAGADVVPAEAPARWMVARVEAIARVIGHVDATHERDLAVDDHRLFVVAMEGMLARVGLAADPGAAGQLLDPFAHLLAGGVKGGHGRTRPHEHSDVDPLGGLGQQLSQRDAPRAAHQLEIRRDVPPSHVDVVARVLDRLGDGGKRVRPVDQHVK